MHVLGSRLALRRPRLGLILGAFSAMAITGVVGCGSEPIQNLDNRTLPNGCGDLDRLACHADETCQPTYEIAAPCAGDDCYEVDFLGCRPKPQTAPQCTPLQCSPRSCAFGRAVDAEGCKLCGCLPPTIPCAEMNEAQCKEAFECRPKYVGDGDLAPCPPDDPNCRQGPTFVGCEAIPDDECQTHADCGIGFCKPGSGTNPSTCVTPLCSDGSQLVCALDRPLCERGSVATIQQGCWTCVDEVTCGKSTCEEPKDVQRTYASRDVNECATIGLSCEGDGEPFNDDCGCGCEVRVGEPRCPPESEGRTYASRDPQQCMVINYSCPADWEAFNNDACGCGCVYAPPPPPFIVVDCGQGTQAVCEALPPMCEDGKVLTVRDECWDCVTSEECRAGI